MDVSNIATRDRATLSKYLLQLELKLKKIYGDSYAKALQIQQVREAIYAGANFTWKGNPQAEKQLDKILDNLANKTENMVANGINHSYEKGQNLSEKAVDAQFEQHKKIVEDVSKEATEQHRINVTDSYTTATGAKGGQTLSDRVWNLNDQSKKELEIAIQNAIIEGKSADEATRDIKKWLNNPDALFRRVKDKDTGELVLSEAAKNYHPGVGVYRSAYKNAMRLARTEINAAYLRAEIESYQSNPLVVGFEVKLSGNHTTLLPNGKVKKLTDICDKLAGKYPKTFMFTGWHPQCRCYIVPITIKDKEADKLIDNKGTITPDDTQGKQIDELPSNMQKWLEDNQPRIDNAKQLPPFIEANKTLIEDAKETANQKQPEHFKTFGEQNIYKGSILQYVENLKKTGKGDGTVAQIGLIDAVVSADLTRRAIKLADKRIFTDQHAATKYFEHPKAKENATLPIADYLLIEKTLTNPTHIYEDTTSKELIYIHTHPYIKGRLLKVVVQPNYRKKGYIYNYAKSWGVVNENTFEKNRKQYKLIK